MTTRLRQVPICGWLAMILTASAAGAGHPSITVPVPMPGETSAHALEITVADIKGSYTIPYIQSDHEVRVEARFAPGGPEQARVCLLRGDQLIAQRRVTADHPRARFPRLHYGEYSLRVESLAPDGSVCGTATFSPLGVGTVIAAIGDSITEGYHGHGFFHDPPDLRAGMFPPEAVSRDGRNFPQFSPTTWHHKPSVNCFQSWMTDLNDTLAGQWSYPVFIANEGWGGITSGAYLNTIRQDSGWQARMKLLRPELWLIHLGVNDERHKVAPADFAANMEQIILTLMEDYGARRDCVFICRPCYDYAPGAEEILRAYMTEIDLLIAQHAVQRGPDFFAAYATDRERLYGTDPVHPNIAGMQLMARLWADAIFALHPQGVWWHDR